MNAYFTTIAADGGARRLLDDCGLPYADLDAPAVRLFGFYLDEELAGMVGLECHGDIGLLRSLAVAARHRGTGLGAVMTAHAERRADEFGLDELYLLTMTARDFFERLGYRTARRDEAPDAIRATQQFSGLCPASSVLMTKRVGA
ncbi:MAG TPA: arsenic resistance N-acetyltransferase ArsN2 [Paucimonas sp.]|nr:arsenic resistance N-acetyltransferase ArsN2 [Paucimonas sp.]